MKGEASAWTFARRSTQAHFGLAFLSLGLLFIALPVEHLYRRDSDLWMVYIGLFILLVGA